MKARVTTCAKRAALFLTIGAGLAIAFYSARPPAEPTFDGKKLSFWLSRVNNWNHSPTEGAEITNAIVTIGSKNTGLLLKWLCEPEPPYREPLGPRVKAWLDSKQHWFIFSGPTRVQFRPSRPGMAFWVFHDFPQVARAAMPAFTNLLSDPDDGTKGKATMILDAIGAEAIPIVEPILSSANPTNRALAIYIIGNRGTNATPFIPRFQAFLNDTSSYPRIAAANALLILKAEPQPVISALVRSFYEGDQLTRTYVSYVLGTATNCADVAVPALRGLLKGSTNTQDRLSIQGALNTLDRDAPVRDQTNVFPAAARSQ
jgi:hypothetical protein